MGSSNNAHSFVIQSESRDESWTCKLKEAVAIRHAASGGDPRARRSADVLRERHKMRHQNLARDYAERGKIREQ